MFNSIKSKILSLYHFLSSSVPQFFPKGYIALIVQSCFKLLYIIYYYIYIIYIQ